jgi:hypothetical protein
MRFDFPLNRQQINDARSAVLEKVPSGNFQISSNGFSTMVAYSQVEGIEDALTQAISYYREESLRLLAVKKHARVTSTFGKGFSRTANARAKSNRRQGIK